MGYAPSLPGNEDRRRGRASALGPTTVRRASEAGGVVAEPVPVTRRGLDPAAIVALAVVVTVAALVAKPWSGPGGGVAAPEETSRPAGAATVPTPSPGSPDDAAPAGADGTSPWHPDGTAVAPPATGVEQARPVDPATWSDISDSLGRIDRFGLVFVARWPGGLYWGFVPFGPGADTGTVAPWPARTPPTRAFGAVPADVVRVTGHLARPVAIGLTRPSEEPAPAALAWLVLGLGAERRLPLRHPFGDVGRYLWMGPGLGLPRGEQRNRREISRWPPMWTAGVYRFDLSTADGARSLVVVLEPDPD